MVPLTRTFLQIDLFARWGLPVILCASTRLGTINHSLLSIEALRRRGIPLLGVAFIGDEQADSERTIVEMGGARRLGRLPHIDPLNGANLRQAFEQNFRRSDFLVDATA
jgi:dethiobiotin synthetase